MKTVQETGTQTIDQMTIIKQIAKRLGIALTTVIAVIELDQRMTMGYCKRGFKVSKNNFVSFVPKKAEAHMFNSPLFKEAYEVPARMSVSVRVSKKFKDYVSNPKAPLDEDVGSIENR